MEVIVRTMLDKVHDGVHVDIEPYACGNRCPLKFLSITSASDFVRKFRLPENELDMVDQATGIKASLTAAYDRNLFQRRMSSWFTTIYGVVKVHFEKAVSENKHGGATWAASNLNSRQVFRYIHKVGLAPGAVIDLFKVDEDKNGNADISILPSNFLPEWLRPIVLQIAQEAADKIASDFVARRKD